MSLAVPNAANNTPEKTGENDEYGKNNAPVRPQASVPEISPVQGLVPVLQWVSSTRKRLKGGTRGGHGFLGGDGRMVC